MAEIVVTGNAIEKSLSILRKGGLVAIPTETVYGLAGDAKNREAIKRIFQVKGRPFLNPLIVHVSDMIMAKELALFDPVSQYLAETFWPGPLTLVLQKTNDCTVHPLAGGEVETIAIRIPSGFSRDLIASFGGALVAPSANISGQVSPTTAQEVEKNLGDQIDLIVDGGSTPLGLESTVVMVRDSQLFLLRPGMTSVYDIEKITGMQMNRQNNSIMMAPGMMKSHYAPISSMRLNVEEVLEGEALLAFGSHRVKNHGQATAILNLSSNGSLRDAAANLFNFMRILDNMKPNGIAVEPIPVEGYGEAINDRLIRAAAPRDV